MLPLVQRHVPASENSAPMALAVAGLGIWIVIAPLSVLGLTPPK